MYTSFGDQLSPPMIPLPTTCVWNLIEDPKEFSYRHVSFFVVAVAGIACDLSSMASCDRHYWEYFFGKFFEHVPSCSLWEQECSSWVTTMCPGNASNFALGVLLVAKVV